MQYNFIFEIGLLHHYALPSDADPRVLRITVRHLLQHAAGWDQKVIGDPLMHRHLPVNTEEAARQAGVGMMPQLYSQGHIINYTLTQPLQFAPGDVRIDKP